MIRIHRKYDTKNVPAGFRGKKRIEKHRLLLDKIHTGTAAEALKFDSGVWKPAKPALKRETGGKCAYCEAPAAGRAKSAAKGGLVAHCDVEHLRPKDLYWWLAHTFENYVLACQVCNQSFKGNKFPATSRLSAPVAVTGNETPAELDALAEALAPDPLDAAARALWESQLAGEDADLIDPLREDPAALFDYKVDETLREVSIAPNAATGRKNGRAASTISILGLEREELRFARYDVYKTVSTFCDVLDDAGISAKTRASVVDELSRLMSGNQPFAGMVRHIVQTVRKLAIQPTSVGAH